MNTHRFKNVFPIGSHLCRKPMPSMPEMKKDMVILKKAGFNLIKLQEHWMFDESDEGKYDFAAYDELIEYAAKLDMGVYLGLTCEQAPPWLYIKHPDCRMVGKNGLPIAYEAQNTMPADGKPGPCFDHPEVEKYQLRFIRKLVNHLGKHENIVVWNTWQEIGYWAEGITGSHVCYCENTLLFFRKWLKEKYKSLDALNAAWRTNYADWSYIQPDRHTSGKTCIPQNFEWKYFMDNVQISNILKKRAEIIKKTDKLGRPVFAHKGAPVIGSGRDWKYAGCQDFMGTSVYPAWGAFHSWDDKKVDKNGNLQKHQSLEMEEWRTGLRMNYIRSCNAGKKPIWAAEFQGGPVSNCFLKGRTPSPEDIRRWMFSLLSAGTTAISFWITRAEIIADECNGFSLLDSTGNTTKRFEEASRIGRALNKHADIFAHPNWAQAEVAILINESNHQLCQTMVGTVVEHIEYSVSGWHRILRESGINIDFMEMSELNGKLENKYKALILPFPLSISEDYAAKLSKYVERGGCLISEACPGRIDENGFCNRGELSPILSKLFAVKHLNFTAVREPAGGKKWSFPERTWGDFADATMLQGQGLLKRHKMRANLYLETFECNGSTPVFKYGKETAGAMNVHGKGKAWILGTFAGHNGTAYSDSQTWESIISILKESGVNAVKYGKLLVSKRVTPRKEAWIFFNPSEEKTTEKISTEAWKRVYDFFGDKNISHNGVVELAVDSLDCRILILER